MLQIQQDHVHGVIQKKKNFKCSDHLINRVYDKIKKNVGQNDEALIQIDFIKTANIIPDILHMFIRVSDKLMLLLRNDLQQMETTFSECIEQNVNFKIRKPYYLKDKTLTIRDLSGVEYIKVFEAIDISIFNLDRGDKKELTWTNFYDLIYKMKDDKITSTELKKQTSAWLSNYLDTVIDTSSSVTPYMHILVSHMHQHV